MAAPSRQTPLWFAAPSRASAVVGSDARNPPLCLLRDDGGGGADDDVHETAAPVDAATAAPRSVAATTALARQRSAAADAKVDTGARCDAEPACFLSLPPSLIAPSPAHFPLRLTATTVGPLGSDCRRRWPPPSLATADAAAGHGTMARPASHRAARRTPTRRRRPPPERQKAGRAASLRASGRGR